MAVNQSRSMNAELAEGMSDGKYKKVVQDRANADPATYEARRDLNDTHFGIHEVNPKVLGDGTVHTTPSFVETPPARIPY